MLRAAVNVYSPFTQKCLFDTPPCESPGLTVEFVKDLVKAAGYSGIQFFEPNNTHDVYHAIVDMVHASEFDFGANLYSQTLNRHSKVHMSIPISHSTGLYYFKTRSSEMIELKMIVLKPFMKMVWISLVILWTLMAISIFLSQIFTAYKIFLCRYLPECFVESMQVAYSILVHEGEVLRPTASFSMTTQMQIVLYSIGFIFIHNFYNAGLLDQLLKREPPQVFKSTQKLADLLATNQLQIVTDYGKDSVWSRLISESTEGPMFDMKNALFNYPPMKVSNRRQVVQAVLDNEKLVGVGGSYGTRYSIRDVCDLTLIQDTATEPHWMSLIFPRTVQGNNLREEFDSIIPSMWPYYSRLEDKYYRKTHRCRDEDNFTKGKPSALKLSDLQDIFWLWIILLSSCCIMVFVEIIYFKIVHYTDMRQIAPTV